MCLLIICGNLPNEITLALNLQRPKNQTLMGNWTTFDRKCALRMYDMAQLLHISWKIRVWFGNPILGDLHEYYWTLIGSWGYASGCISYFPREIEKSFAWFEAAFATVQHEGQANAHVKNIW